MGLQIVMELDLQNVHGLLAKLLVPGMDGLEMCKRIRETNNIPIIMLSARSTLASETSDMYHNSIISFINFFIPHFFKYFICAEHFAGIYVVKPFNPLELTARVKSQLRRYTQLNPNSNANPPHCGDNLILSGILFHLASETSDMYHNSIISFMSGISLMWYTAL